RPGTPGCRHAPAVKCPTAHAGLLRPGGGRSVQQVSSCPDGATGWSMAGEILGTGRLDSKLYLPVSEKRNNSTHIPGIHGKFMQTERDSTDLRLLQALQDNARLTSTELAGVAHLSQSPSWRRVRRMEDSGLIRGYHARLDRQGLGYGVMAF